MKHTAMTILYELHDNLYINLTNRCPCSCTFCLRQNREDMGTSDSLWLEHEPSFEEVAAEFENFDMDRYHEIVFCGFGEPTEALDVLLKTAHFIKEHWEKPIRINTNGLGNLIHGRDITPSFEGLIDTLSISLNTPDPQKYYWLVRPRFGEISHDAMLEFARNSKKYVPNVVLTTVSTTLTSDEEEQCRRICQDLGVTYRIRPFEN